MTSNSNSLSDRDDELDELVFAYLELRDDGDSHKGALSKTLSAAPDRERDLLGSLEALNTTGLLASEDSSTDNFPDELGGYRLLRRLGSGGMGIVFLAQGETGDPVALKLIRPEQLYFDRARARFQRELESASRLDHEGVAQVLASGEELGIPYLAQRWVPGVSLDTILSALGSRLPGDLTGASLLETLLEIIPPEAEQTTVVEAAFEGTWEESVLRIIGQVARALEHAHEKGVLHRDVKPSNIMLTTEGKAVLVDFGLASVSDGTRLTRTGAQPGSLPYMAPEQVDGSPRQLDERTDVYSLGITLYQLLTLRHPFKSRASERVRALILDSNPLPLRKLNGQIRQGTETLCLKAMDREPRRRYQTAVAFAEDVNRLLTGQTIVGRAPKPWVRLARWVKRKPLQAAALFLIVAAPVSWAGLSQSRLKGVQGAYQKERDAKAMVDRHLGMTLVAIRRLFADLAAASIDNTPHLQETRVAAIELALEVMEELCAERPDDLLVQAERGHLVRQRANYLGGMGRIEEAIAGYEEHMRVYQNLVDNGPEDQRLTYKRQLSLSTERRAALLISGIADPASFVAYEDALDLLREVYEESSIASGAHSQLAIAMEIYTHALRKAGRYDEALEVVDEALAIGESVTAEFPNSPQALQVVARLVSARLLLFLKMHREIDELAERKRIVALLQRAVDLNPKDRKALSNFTEHAALAAQHISDYGELDEAMELSNEAVEAARYLVESFPTITAYKERLQRVLSSHGIVLGRAGHQAEGNKLLKEQAEIAYELHVADPDNIETREAAITMLNNLAVSELFYTQDAERVFATIDRARELLIVGFETHPNREHLRKARLALLYAESLMWLFSDELDDAHEHLERFEELADLEQPKWQVSVADLWAEWVASVKRVAPTESELIYEGCDRAFGALNRALDEGYNDRIQLLASTMLIPSLGEDPRWAEFLQRIDEEAPK